MKRNVMKYIIVCVLKKLVKKHIVADVETFSPNRRCKSDEDILEERQKAIKSAEEKIGEPVEVIDSFFEKAPVDAKPLWFLGKSLELLAGADVAYFAPGWEDARGCKIEHTCAVEYGIDRIEP